MDQIWKWVMHLNAKAFCLVATLFFFGVSLWCGWTILHPREQLQDGAHGKAPELAPAWTLGTLDFVSNQLTSESLAIPVDPFRPTIEAIFTNETERAAFLKALKAAQNAAAGLSSTAGVKKEDPFAHLRKKNAVPGALTGANGLPMVIPKLTFMGFFQRPDGKQAAMFYDSVNDTTVFYDSGKQVHGVDVLDANVHEAKIKFPDGTTRTLPIGGSVELAAEPAKAPPKKAAVPKAAETAAKAGAGKAGAAKAGVAKPGAVKPGVVKPGAAKPGADNKAAAQPKVAKKKVAPQKAKEL